jgi:hypothetical protein
VTAWVRAGAVAGFEFKAHPRPEGHDTRSLQAYLGHKNMQHIVRSPSCPQRILGLACHRIPKKHTSLHDIEVHEVWEEYEGNR